MSRCFPFPPPGYAGKCASNEALIMSIKLQRENEKVKSDKKKEWKREKKEKKEKRREQHKAKLIADNEKGLGEGKSIQDEPMDRSKYELELLEKSNLTEEHGRPCNSFESTENSAKRKRDAEPPKIIQNHGNIIRIRCRGLFSPSAGMSTTAQKNFRNVPHLSQNLVIPPEKSTVVAHHSLKHDKPLPSPATRSATAVLQAPKMQCPLPERTEITILNRTPSTSSWLQDTEIQKMELERGDPLLSHKMNPPLWESIGISTPSHLRSRSDDKKVQKMEVKLTDPAQSVKFLPSLGERVDTAMSGHAASLSRSDDEVQKMEAKHTDSVKSDKILPPLAYNVDTEMPGDASSTSRSYDKKVRKKAAKYRELLERWVLPPLHSVPNADDQEWLFSGRKEKDDNPTKGLKVEEHNLPKSGSFALQPQAVYLADVGIYALPYTVPF